MSEIRECPVCGNKYKFCPHCSNGPSWKMLYDTESCKEIANTISAYNMKLLNKDKASSILEKIPMKDCSSYKSEIASVLQEIMVKPEIKPRGRRKRKLY